MSQVHLFYWRTFFIGALETSAPPLRSRSLLALVPLRHDEICGGRGDDVEHEEVEDDMPVAALASNVEAEQIEHAGIHHQKHEIEKKLAGLFCCHFVCCHNCMFLKIIIGLLLFGGC